MSEVQPGVRGSMKICSRKKDTVAISLMLPETRDANVLTFQMPIGGYSIAEDIQPTCGIVGDNAYICDMDDPSGFYVTGRFGAQLIWFKQGALEYRFSYQQMDKMEIEWLELSFEAGSEVPMHRDPWKSDIAVSINGKRLGIWTSPCDCGGRHGRITPDWWLELGTLYGFLKAWRVTQKGSFVENDRLSDINIKALGVSENPYITVRIEVPEDAQNLGGINLFGERFGNYAQGIVLCMGLVNNLNVLIWLMLAGVFNIFLIRNFMKSIPKALDEAATIDGASSFQVYTKIILPSIMPVMIIVGLFAFNGAWNDYLWPRISVQADVKC